MPSFPQKILLWGRKCTRLHLSAYSFQNIFGGACPGTPQEARGLWPLGTSPPNDKSYIEPCNRGGDLSGQDKTKMPCISIPCISTGALDEFNAKHPVKSFLSRQPYKINLKLETELCQYFGFIQKPSSG